MKRINSIDIVRGLVMVIMALDHVRDLIHVDALTHNPTNLATTTPVLFFTRWITHLCAPTFVFLAGVSAFLSFEKNIDKSQTRIFLIKRGFWLILLEFTIVNFGIFFDLSFHSLLFLVIAAIGFGFIMLGVLLKLSSKIIGIIGLAILFTHNLFPLISLADGSLLKSFITPFFNVALISITKETNFIIGYPPIPWLGIMFIGFASGKLFLENQTVRINKFTKIGSAALILFIVFRFIGIYGEPSLWASQKNTLYTFLSFINVTKNPPSLLFCLLILGLMFLMLAFAEKTRNKSLNLLSVYGKVPLFYFVVHFYVIHIVLLAILYFQGFTWTDFSFTSGNYGRPKNITTGVHLWQIYLLWIVIVVGLYKPCVWFGKYKAIHNYWWLKYV